MWLSTGRKPPSLHNQLADPNPGYTVPHRGEHLEENRRGKQDKAISTPANGDTSANATFQGLERKEGKGNLIQSPRAPLINNSSVLRSPSRLPTQHIPPPITHHGVVEGQQQEATDCPHTLLRHGSLSHTLDHIFYPSEAAGERRQRGQAKLSLRPTHFLSLCLVIKCPGVSSVTHRSVLATNIAHRRMKPCLPGVYLTVTSPPY